MNATLAYLQSLQSQGDRLLLWVVWLMFGLNLALAPWHDTWLPALAIGLPTALLCSLQVRLAAGRLPTRAMIGCAMMTLTAVAIHQGHGMIELHFGVFVSLALLLIYRDWIVLVAAAGFIAVHHLSLDYLQRQGLPLWVFAENTGYHIVLIHAGYVVAETAVLVLLSRQLQREALDVGASPTELGALAQRIARGEITDDARLADAAPGSLAASVHALQGALAQMLGDVRTVVAAQADGDFSQRVGSDGREGLLREIADGINGACTRLERSMREAVAVLRAVGDGDLSRRMDSDGGGLLAEIRDQLHETVDFLGRFRDSQRRIIDATLAGQLDQRMPLQGLQGYQLELATATNRMVAELDRILEQLSLRMSRLAEGDLSDSAERQQAAGRFGELMRHVATSVAQLAAVVGEVRTAGETVRNASAEIVQGNRDMAERTERQAADLESAAASMTQLAGKARDSARHAQDMAQLTGKTSEVASRGGQSVTQLVDTMQNIADASRRIEEIISVIDGIAFQTNILALNASVEAARAGEQGRGFAVVAAEVRALASRSASAAREIGTLIRETVGTIEVGNERVHEARGTIDDVVASVRDSQALITSISQDAAAQSETVSGLASFIEKLDHDMSLNAALGEEIGASTQLLEQQSRSMNEAVRRFRLNGDDQPSAQSHAA